MTKTASLQKDYRCTCSVWLPCGVYRPRQISIHYPHSSQPRSTLAVIVGDCYAGGEDQSGLAYVYTSLALSLLVVDSR